MKFRNKIIIAFASAMLSPVVTVCFLAGSFSAEAFVFTLPVLVFIVPLLIFALILSDNRHRRPAIIIFSSGMIVYLGYAIFTLGGELMLPMIGEVYVPSILIMTPFCLYAICHQPKRIQINGPSQIKGRL